MIKHSRLISCLQVYGSILTKGKYTQQHTLPLHGMTVDDVEDTDEAVNGIQINHRNKSFLVYCLSRGDKTNWLASLRKYTTLVSWQSLSLCLFVSVSVSVSLSLFAVPFALYLSLFAFSLSPSAPSSPSLHPLVEQFNASTILLKATLVVFSGFSFHRLMPSDISPVQADLHAQSGCQMSRFVLTLLCDRKVSSPVAPPPPPSVCIHAHPPPPSDVPTGDGVYDMQCSRVHRHSPTAPLPLLWQGRLRPLFSLQGTHFFM